MTVYVKFLQALLLLKKCFRLQLLLKIHMNKIFSKGFSLLEIMIVLAVLMIIMFFGVLYQTNTDQFIVRTELDTLYLIFMTLAQKAQLEKRDITLTFDPLAHKYNYENTEHVLTPYTFLGYEDSAKGPPSQPAQLLNHSVTFGNNQVTFYADGT